MSLKVIATCSSKGGCGRTTISTHLAVAATNRRKRVLLLDLDPSTSASQWADFREASTPKVISIAAQRLTKTIEAARDEYDLVVIDGAPNAPEAMMEACDVADLILVPSRPGIIDIRVNRTTAKIAAISGKTPYAIINQARVGSALLVSDAKAALREHGFDTTAPIVHARAAFSHCMIMGQTAQEYEWNGKAAAEIDDLLTWALKVLARDQRKSQVKTASNDQVVVP